MTIINSKVHACEANTRVVAFSSLALIRTVQKRGFIKFSSRKPHFYKPTAFKVPRCHQSPRQIFCSVVMQSKLNKGMPQHLRGLTARERQIAALVCVGHSNKTIARKLQVSEGTIKTHLHAIYLKLGIENRASLSAAIDNAPTGTSDL